jgi:hypothetical protein
MFEELWCEDCNICFEEKDIFFINTCQCKNKLCKTCFNKLQKAQCPFCRSDITTKTAAGNRSSMAAISAHALYNHVTTLDKNSAKKAKKNWNFWFNFYNGREIMRPYVPYLGNHDAIHRILLTGRFNDPETGGVCLNKGLARLYVENQLRRFQTNNVYN